jgi:Manganese containing catalase
MHQQQWLAVLEELGPEMATNAPGDFENTGEFADHAYNFINHHLDTELDPAARFATGPSFDGKGEFQVVDPASASAPEPELQKVPPEVHAGLESTAPAPTNGGGGIAGRFTRLATDVADKLTPGDETADPYEEMTKDELLEEARAAGIGGRSQMSKKELIGALRDQ